MAERKERRLVKFGGSFISFSLFHFNKIKKKKNGVVCCVSSCEEVGGVVFHGSGMLLTNEMIKKRQKQSMYVR